MTIIIKAIGGYKEIGKNMTAVKVDDEVVIFDMGLHLPNYIQYTNEDRDDVVHLEEHTLQKVQAIPDDRIIEDWKDKVVAIVPSHAHLDHVGAVPFVAQKYKAPIISTPLTIAVLDNILEDEKIELPNKKIAIKNGGSYKISEKLTLEFINMTHSILQTAMVALHTPYGTIIYGNDFKLDDTPVINQPPGYEQMDKLQKEGVKALIVDCLNCTKPIRTPSEKIARDQLKDVMLKEAKNSRAIIVTTFSSNLERLYSIIEYAQQLNRKVVFMGRSLFKYVSAGEKVGLVNFSKDVELCKYGRQVKKRLREIQEEGPQNYVLVVTGHQGEPKATLAKMANKVLPFEFTKDDCVIFSSRVIPTAINIEDRKRLIQLLERHRVTIFKDVHVSGHGSQEDMKILLNHLKPEFLLPAHGEEHMVEAFVELGKSEGYKNIKVLENGDELSL